MNEKAEIVDKQLKAYNERNLESFLNTYDDKVIVYEFETNKIITEGKKQLSNIMQMAFEKQPDSKTYVVSRINQHNLVIDLEKVTNHHEDESKIITTVAIYEVKNKLITRVWFTNRIVE